MDTPDDTQSYQAETEQKYDSENRSPTMHAARRGLTFCAHADEGHRLTGEFLTSRKETIALSPGEDRILQLPPNGGARSVLRESENHESQHEMDTHKQNVERQASFFRSATDVFRTRMTRNTDVSDKISEVATEDRSDDPDMFRSVTPDKSHMLSSTCDAIGEFGRTVSDKDKQLRRERETDVGRSLLEFQRQMADEVQSQMEQKCQMLKFETNTQNDRFLEKLMSAQQWMMEAQQQQIAESANQQVKQMLTQQQHAEEQRRQAAAEQQLAVSRQQQILEQMMQTMAQVASNSEKRTIQLENTVASLCGEIQHTRSDLESRIEALKIEMPSRIAPETFQSTPMPFGLRHENAPPPNMSRLDDPVADASDFVDIGPKTSATSMEATVAKSGETEMATLYCIV